MIVVVAAIAPMTPPVTVPVELIDAIDVVLLLHIPPPASDNDIVKPEHTIVAPIIGVGKGLTVINVVM